MIDFDVSLPVGSMDAFVSDVQRCLDAQVPGNCGLHVLGHLATATCMSPPALRRR